MVPVLDMNQKPLMPCTEKRARLLMERGKAKAYWKRGFFCIILQQEPSDTKLQPVVIGIDPGSKREGYTVATEKHIIMNILTDTPYRVKEKVGIRRNRRNARRGRNTPYRKCRYNRKIGGLVPSIKARWGAKLRLIKYLLKLIPLTHVNVEDIKALTKIGHRRWNKLFSTLEIGKLWFYSEIQIYGLQLYLTEGWETYDWRKARGFKKTKEKLKNTWNAHCVDSHVLCERTFGNIEPFYGMYRLNWLQPIRRQLHVYNPIKGGYRKSHGKTVSMGIPRGTLIKHKKYKLCYLGGSSNGKLSLHNFTGGKRMCHNVKKEDCIFLQALTKWNMCFIPNAKNIINLKNVEILELKTSLTEKDNKIADLSAALNAMLKGGMSPASESTKEEQFVWEEQKDKVVLKRNKYPIFEIIPFYSCGVVMHKVACLVSDTIETKCYDRLAHAKDYAEQEAKKMYNYAPEPKVCPVDQNVCESPLDCNDCGHLF